MLSDICRCFKDILFSSAVHFMNKILVLEVVSVHDVIHRWFGNFFALLLHIIVLNPNFFYFSLLLHSNTFWSWLFSTPVSRIHRPRKAPSRISFVTITSIHDKYIVPKNRFVPKANFDFQKPNTDVTANVKQSIFPIPLSIVVKIMLSILPVVCYLSLKTDVTYWVHLLITDTVNGTI